METINYTVPIGDVQVASLMLDIEHESIRVEMVSTTNSNRRIRHNIVGARATTLMIALNKADLTTKSLHRRLMELLVSDGILTGSIIGTPD